MLNCKVFILIVLALTLSVSVTLAYNNGVARLPPMGWNTWCTQDICGLIDICTDSEIRSVADSIVEQGLDELGYNWGPHSLLWLALSRSLTLSLSLSPALFIIFLTLYFTLMIWFYSLDG